MNLHIFNDSHGFILNITVKRFVEMGVMKNNYFINLNKKTIYTNPRVEYLKKNIFSFKRAIKKLPPIISITFYPFDFTAAAFFKEFKKSYPSAKINWVFWSYEYYHRPDINHLNFDHFSTDYYKRKKTFLSNFKKTFSNTIKKILFIPVFNINDLFKCYNDIEKFYSFLPMDFKNVFQYINNKTCEYHPISFISIEDMNSEIVWGKITNEVMIGHAATPFLNHFEIMDKLYNISFSANLLLPLEYGEKQYRKDIKKRASILFNNRVEFLEKRLDMQQYYQRLSNIGYAIFNFRWQEALGNIVFLIWNGAKIFLKEESSVYQQFIVWDLIVFSIEHHLNKENITNLLTFEEKHKNKIIIENLFSEKKVKKYWEQLI